MARILVVEDEPTIVMVLQKVFGFAGHQVVSASNGALALEILHQSPRPELLLVDLMMPVMSGRALIETMREDPNLADIPVVVLTGAVTNVYDFPPQESYQAIINKPFDLNQVLKTVEELLKAE